MLETEPLSPSQRRRSRNDLFSQSFTTAPNVLAPKTVPTFDSSALPSELLDYLPKALQPTPDHSLPLRLSPTPAYLLGQGRHSMVYLASYKAKSGQWTLCAAKRIQSDPVSQQSAFNEVYLSSKLEGCPFIIRLLALKEENDETVELLDPGPSLRRSRSSLRPESGLFPAKVKPALSLSTAPRPHLSQQYFNESPIRLTHALEDRPVRRVVSLRHSPAAPSVELPETRVADGPHLILVQELAGQGSLASFIRRQPHKLGRKLWLKLAKQLVTALLFCHGRSIIHADVKTQNVMLTDSLDVRLSDFGTSFPLADQRRPLSGQGLGTTAYAAPELIATPPAPFGLEVDVFSCGVTLYCMISGREPYAALRPVEQILFASRGHFWEWEQNKSLALSGDSWSAPSSRRSSFYSLNAQGSTDSLESASSFVNGHKTGKISREAVALLLEDPEAPSAAFSDDPPVSSLAEEDPEDVLPPRSNRNSRSGSLSLQHYSDGGPVQFFLSGPEIVPEGVLRLLARMTAALPADRPTMLEVANSLAVF